MFCNQCEQTTRGDVCHQWGACGKSPEVDALQDLLVHCLRGLSQVALQAKSLGLATRETDEFTCEMLFSTLTNVNFSTSDFISFVNRAIALRESLKLQIQATGNAVIQSAINSFQPASDTQKQIQQGKDLEFEFISQSAKNVDIFSLKLTLLYGLKGVAAYAFHALELNQHDESLYIFFHEVLANLDAQDKSLQDWLDLTLKVGQMNLKAMELLDAGNTETFGHPTPTTVPLGHTVGKAILVSGHDLLALKAVLEQTSGTGIKVYTHGELLPAHGYPKLKQTHPHLYGHYGTAWQNQTHEFERFPGAIVMTTNCLMPPHETYKDKVFTLGPVGYPGLQHISIHDISLVIQKALELPGFTEDSEQKTVTTGFARNAVLGVADTVINAVKQGDIRHFFLVGGCDGAKPGRNYYSDLVEKIPNDCVVLTLGCGKFRFFDQNLGDIGGIPRLLDLGQCNDAYSAIQIAVALANTFEVNVNQLPLSMILSWYEQKAIAVLLTLLYLGIQNIRIGPTLPAFLTPNVVKLLSETFHLQLITTPEQDLAVCLG
ncbi:Hybrid cluster protein [Trichormus variabilis ATCC 29413]|uniref:Hydroxylamine reductase n=2 Tax=Anabaena variabilis TaxID=264691 RepID=HCP_TRIV2|nr:MULTISPECIES: hydroxylamine reductase [Nostocaceae]Q3M890.1 RecName: Full=Hydroxylamine reductase; AltName: Full=Hybrid-cluster protein; Short=HCP; AltName: Full=Prismane protein [Trichormus variabilis ATCC 29413]ABA22796.1 Hybrid cluster protein [Trichormus variabilis ATCC 29413]MBC1216592.1 hydroxylamine reductase [Trichormus variabilis ARAD]MBC1256078.1 hydroxylamine reductase [Trichormus variabilis V5]MBC1268391.1 hydroxylamine reductase [Trichormus variabilis FSR]MBC1304699.1 hydroxyl